MSFCFLCLSETYLVNVNIFCILGLLGLVGIYSESLANMLI